MKRIIFLLSFLLLILSFNINKVEANDSLKLTSDAKSAILIEASTGSVIYEVNADEKREPASMTKIMTMLLVLEAIDNNLFSMDSILTTSEYASSMGGSQIYLEPGEQMSVEDLFKSMCIASANDASVVLAEAVGGSYENFIKMMNDKALEIGMTNTTFINCNGLPEEGHLSTSRDIAILSRYIVNKYGDKILNYTSIYEDYIRQGTDKEFWLVNTNKLVKYIDGMRGLKTGYCGESSGYCLSAVLDRNNTKYIAVIMGASEAKLRNLEIVQMLSYASNNYELITLHKKGEVVTTKYICNIKPNKLNVALDEDVNILLKKGEKLEGINTDYKITVTDKEISDNLVINVGYLEVLKDGKVISKVDLKISEEISYQRFFDLFIDILKDVFLI